MILFLNLISAETTYTASTKTVCNGVTCTKTLYSGPVAYLENGQYVPINTTIVSSSDPLFDYEVTRGVYSAFFKSDPTSGQAVKFLKDDIEVTFQPMALNYRNDLNQLQQVNMIQGVAGLPGENVFSYSNAYGPGITLLYKYYEDNLKEGLVIDSLGRLPLPAQYIIDGGNPTLDLDFVMTTNSQHIVIEGQEWDLSSTERTSEEVFIKDNSGKILYRLNKPIAYDAAGDSINLEYEFKKSSSKLYVIIKTNYTWLSDAVFPVEIDPTLTLQDADTENLDDSMVLQEFPDNTYGTVQYLYVKGTEFLNHAERAYIKFDTASIGSDITITKCLLGVFVISAASTNPLIDIYNTSNDWNESGLTWNNKPAESVVQNSTYAGTVDDVWLISDVTNITNASYHSGTNVSFVYKLNNELTIRYIVFYSKETVIDVTKRPYLNITYTDVVAPYWTSHTNNASSSKIGNRVRWNVSLTDNFDLNSYVFANNQTGTWTNTTLQSISGTNAVATYDLVINATRGTYVCGQFWFDDVDGNANTTNTSCFTVANSPPLPDNVSIDPSPASASQDLNCTYDYYDADSDSSGGVNFLWYNSSVLYPVTTQVLGSGNTTNGEKWLCSVKVNDSIEFSSWVNSSELTVGDSTSPVLENITIPSSATQSVQTTLYASCYDAGSSIEYVKMNVTDTYAQKSTLTFSHSTGNIYTYRYTPTGAGNYYFSGAICRDTSGNSVTNSSTFTMYVSAAASGGGGGGGSSYTRCNWKIYRPYNQIINGFGKPGELSSSYNIQVYNNETQTVIFNFRAEEVDAVFKYETIEVSGSSYGSNDVRFTFSEEKSQTGKVIIEAGGCDSAVDVYLVSNEGGWLFALFTGDIGLLPALGAWIVVIVLIIFVVVSLK